MSMSDQEKIQKLEKNREDTVSAIDTVKTGLYGYLQNLVSVNYRADGDFQKIAKAIKLLNKAQTVVNGLKPSTPTEDHPGMEVAPVETRN